jgi:MFS family permease
MTDFINRGLVLALYNFPTIINLFAASVAAQSFLDKGAWRWAYGHITILMIATSAPIIFGLWRIHFKAKKREIVVVRQQEAKSFFEKLKWVLIEIDIVGSLLLVAGLFLILLPLILANSWGGWGNGKVPFNFIIYHEIINLI